MRVPAVANTRKRISKRIRKRIVEPRADVILASNVLVPTRRARQTFPMTPQSQTIRRESGENPPRIRQESLKGTGRGGGGDPDIQAASAT